MSNDFFNYEDELEYNPPKKKEPAFKINEAGQISKKVFEDIAKGVTSLKPVSGRIYVEVNLSIEDESIFRDDEIRQSKLIVEVNLGGLE